MQKVKCFLFFFFISKVMVTYHYPAPKVWPVSNKGTRHQRAKRTCHLPDCFIVMVYHLLYFTCQCGSTGKPLGVTVNHVDCVPRTLYAKQKQESQTCAHTHTHTQTQTQTHTEARTHARTLALKKHAY